MCHVTGFSPSESTDQSIEPRFIFKNSKLEKDNEDQNKKDIIKAINLSLYSEYISWHSTI